MLRFSAKLLIYGLSEQTEIRFFVLGTHQSDVKCSCETHLSACMTNLPFRYFVNSDALFAILQYLFYFTTIL